MNSSTLADIDPPELRKIDSLELRTVENLEAQLIARFSPPLHPKKVQRSLIDCAASYGSARVRSYLQWRACCIAVAGSFVLAELSEVLSRQLDNRRTA